jgi:hypothetical protein
MASTSSRREEPRYRIVAAEAHSWSSLLIEDELGRRYLCSVAAKTLTPLPTEAVESLLAARAYRPWRGDRSWSTLDRLPILPERPGAGAAPNLPVAVPGGGVTEESVGS